MDLVGVRPDTMAEAVELLRELDAAIAFGTSWLENGGQLEIRAVRGDRYTVLVLGEERAELTWIQRGRGLVRMTGWGAPEAGLALPPNLARKAWEMSRLKLTA